MHSAARVENSAPQGRFAHMSSGNASFGPSAESSAGNPIPPLTAHLRYVLGNSVPRAMESSRWVKRSGSERFSYPVRAVTWVPPSLNSRVSSSEGPSGRELVADCDVILVNMARDSGRARTGGASSALARSSAIRGGASGLVDVSGTTRTLLSFLPRGIIVVYNIRNGSKTPLFTPYDLPTEGNSERRGVSGQATSMNPYNTAILNAMSETLRPQARKTLALTRSSWNESSTLAGGTCTYSVSRIELSPPRATVLLTDANDTLVTFIYRRSVAVCTLNVAKALLVSQDSTTEALNTTLLTRDLALSVRGGTATASPELFTNTLSLIAPLPAEACEDEHLPGVAMEHGATLTGLGLGEPTCTMHFSDIYIECGRGYRGLVCILSRPTDKTTLVLLARENIITEGVSAEMGGDAGPRWTVLVPWAPMKVEVLAAVWVPRRNSKVGSSPRGYENSMSPRVSARNDEPPLRVYDKPPLLLLGSSLGEMLLYDCLMSSSTKSNIAAKQLEMIPTAQARLPCEPEIRMMCITRLECSEPQETQLLIGCASRHVIQGFIFTLHTTVSRAAGIHKRPRAESDSDRGEFSTGLCIARLSCRPLSGLSTEDFFPLALASTVVGYSSRLAPSPLLFVLVSSEGSPTLIALNPMTMQCVYVQQSVASNRAEQMLILGGRAVESGLQGPWIALIDGTQVVVVKDTK